MAALASSDCCTPLEAAPAVIPSERDRLLDACRELADPTRLEIFRLIATQHEPICVCHIVDRFAVSQPTISHHLRVLRDAGLATVSRRGVWAYYSSDTRGVERVRAALNQLTPLPLAAGP